MGLKIMDISDELESMQMYLERSELMIQHLTDDYFGIYDPDKVDGRVAIAGDYKRHGIHSFIASDCLFHLRERLQNLTTEVQKELKNIPNTIVEMEIGYGTEADITSLTS